MKFLISWSCSHYQVKSYETPGATGQEETEAENRPGKRKANSELTEPVQDEPTSKERKVNEEKKPKKPADNLL